MPSPRTRQPPKSPSHCGQTLRAILVLACTVIVLAIPAICEELPQRITDVRIEGNETIPASVILQKIQTQPDRDVSSRQIREDKRSLMSTRWFYSVQERFEDTPQGTVLIFKVHERPIVKKVEFIGNEKIKTKQLASWTGLKVGSPFDHMANREAVNRIEQEYREKGHFFVKVELVKGGEPGDREVIFRINEGPKVRVTSRVFSGVGDVVSAARLKTKLQSKSAILGLFGGLYRPETLQQDEYALKQYYNDLGFFDVQVETEPLFSRDRSRVRLHYTVSEGTRYRVREIRVEGNQVLSTAQLQAIREMNEGDYFNALPLSKDVRYMLGLYGERGHYFASVRPVYHFTEQPGIVDLVFDIDEDRKRYIRNFDVAFMNEQSHTKETVILDRMQVEPGDLADPKLIGRGRSRVNGGGLFEGVQVNVIPVDPETDQFLSASDSRTFRGQQPLGGFSYGQPDWTDRFEYNVRYAAYEHAATGGTAARIPYGHSVLSTEPPSNSPTAPRPPTGGHTSGDAHSAPANAAPKRDDEVAAETTDGQVMLLPRNPLPQMLEYQLAQPAALFHQPPEDLLVSNFPPAEDRDDDVIIRGQSPGGSFYGQTPTPRPGDAILQGSPFNNQFQTPPPGWVDINVQAAEGRTGRLMFGFGVNSDAGIVGSFVWDESNFDLFRPPQTFADIIEGRAWRGGGQRFRFEAAPGDIVSRYALQWTDPYFMYTDYSLSVSGFFFNRFYPDWDEERLGGRVAVGRQLTPEWSVAAALRLEDVNLRGVAAGAPAILQQAVGDNFLSTGRLSVTHDTRDAVIMPGTGHYFDAGYEQAFGDFTYPRFEGEFRQYFTLHQRPDGSGRQVLTLAGDVGWSGDDTPVFERFYAGGFQSFRGFAFRGVTPRINNIGIGGNFKALGTVEYRIPLTADDMINFVAFTDVGTVEESASLANFRATAGVGLRVVVPAMGPVPLAFDFAFPIKSQAFDDERIFSFYVGINR
ncbi:MAG: outer membrane protein assembly factor [Planctomycetaceae bacterium]